LRFDIAWWLFIEHQAYDRKVSVRARPLLPQPSQV
jgi:hypothetical protein